MELEKIEWMEPPEKEPNEEKHFNCFQRTLMAYADRMDLTQDEAANLGAYFGGGMRCGGTCGPVNAALLILGHFWGERDDLPDVGKDFLIAFAKANGSWLCEDIRDEEHSKCGQAIEWTIQYIQDHIPAA